MSTIITVVYWFMMVWTPIMTYIIFRENKLIRKDREERVARKEQDHKRAWA